MFRRIRGASAANSNADTHPLPPRPSLEYERKQAKMLLRQLRAGDPAALARARARHGAPSLSASVEITLADAQLVVAREYGFASWPRLVQYFGDVQRQGMARRTRQSFDRAFYENSARSLIARHHHQRPHAGRSLAASVPRFYGKTITEVFASTVSEDDARLTVARENGYASWEMLMDAIDARRAKSADPWSAEQGTLNAARKAINNGNVDALSRIVAEHPELLRPSNEEQREGRTVVAIALAAEEQGIAGARVITDWLADHGANLSLTLNERLCGRMFLTPANVHFLLDRGGDPNWIAPNGISVLEHALLRYWNGEAVDLIARRVTPKRAL